MSNSNEEHAILGKTRDLCQSIVDEPTVLALRQKMDAFMGDSQLCAQYEALMQKGEVLHQKQHAGESLNPVEVKEFEKLRESFLKNPVASAFLDAQEDIHKLKQTINQYVSKTFKLGRVPTAADLESGGCGSGCGCHH